MGNNSVNNFSKNLKYYRKKNNMTQENLADKVGVTHQAISTYEKGTRTCSFDTLIEFAKLFEVSIDDLLL